MTSQKQPPADPVRVARLQAELARAEINHDYTERARLTALDLVVERIEKEYL